MKPRSPISRSAAPQRKTPPRKRNPKRQRSEFARCYGSKARVEWVKSLPCAMCSYVGAPSDNAHVGDEGKGAGRKANYDQIAPLCRTCHGDYDNSGGLYARDTDSGLWRRMLVRCAADRTQAAWLEHLGEA